MFSNRLLLLNAVLYDSVGLPAVQPDSNDDSKHAVDARHRREHDGVARLLVAREEGSEGREGSKRERVEEVGFLDCQHESRQVHVVYLEDLAAKLFGRDIAAKKRPWQQDREQNRLLQQA